MVKYSDKGRRKTVEKLTTQQGLGILVATGCIMAGLILLRVLGYVPFDVH
jgi:hypothetical protein